MKRKRNNAVIFAAARGDGVFLCITSDWPTTCFRERGNTSSLTASPSATRNVYHVVTYARSFAPNSCSLTLSLPNLSHLTSLIYVYVHVCPCMCMCASASHPPCTNDIKKPYDFRPKIVPDELNTAIE